MKRSEFITTIKGQEYGYFKRNLQVLFLKFHQEPKTKTISTEAAKSFRASVQTQMQKANRRPFGGDIVLQIDFFSTDRCPYPVQTLVKNYLDLLHKPMPDIDGLEKLLFKDDNQVKLLIANHYVNSKDSLIYIKAYRFSNFVKDAEYAEYIIHNKFTDRNYSIRSGFERDKKELDFYPSLGELIREYEHLKHIPADVQHPLALFQEDNLKRQIQQKYVRQNDLQVEQLLEYLKALFYRNRKSGRDGLSDQLSNWLRDYMFIGLDFIPIGGAPIKEGQRKIFRKHLQKKLNQFVHEHPYLFPLLQPVGLTIIVIPPVYNCPDADNLARQIVQFFDQICRPPLSHTTLPNLPTSRNEKVKISTSSYQILYLPRNNDDPEDGKIMVLIDTDFLSLSGVWAKVKKLIERWEDYIKYKHY